VLISMLRDTKGRTLKTALQSDFSRVSAKVAEEICKAAGLNPEMRPRSLGVDQIEALFRAIPKVKVMAPRPAASCDRRGAHPRRAEAGGEGRFLHLDDAPAGGLPRNPFIVEAGLAYGGEQPAEELVDLWRFANRVPLQYQQSACAITAASSPRTGATTDCSRKGALPTADDPVRGTSPASGVPFTSESKEASPPYPEIIRELKLGLQEVGRRLGGFLRHRQRLAEADKKRSYIESYIPHIASPQGDPRPVEAEEEKIVSTLTDTLEKSRLP